jgi:hypothetical protein
VVLVVVLITVQAVVQEDFAVLLLQLAVEDL